jgi:hypothetical protein
MKSLENHSKVESSHPAKAIFNKHGVPLKYIARYIKRDYFYTSRLLSGTIRITPILEKQIWKLARQVEKAGAKNA